MFEKLFKFENVGKTTFKSENVENKTIFRFENVNNAISIICYKVSGGESKYLTSISGF